MWWPGIANSSKLPWFEQGKRPRFGVGFWQVDRGQCRACRSRKQKASLVPGLTTFMRGVYPSPRTNKAGQDRRGVDCHVQEVQCFTFDTNERIPLINWRRSYKVQSTESSWSLYSYLPRANRGYPRASDLHTWVCHWHISNPADNSLQRQMYKGICVCLTDFQGLRWKSNLDLTTVRDLGPRDVVQSISHVHWEDYCTMLYGVWSTSKVEWLVIWLQSTLYENTSIPYFPLRVELLVYCDQNPK